MVKSRGIQAAAVCGSLSDRFTSVFRCAVCASEPAGGGAGGGWVWLKGCFKTVGVSREIN